MAIVQSLHISPDLSELRVDSGGSVLLQCILDGDSTHGGSFSWTGPAVDSGRANITLDNSRTVSTLTIESADRSDEGEYICSFAGVGRVSITLDVRCKLPKILSMIICIGVSSHISDSINFCFILQWTHTF